MTENPAERRRVDGSGAEANGNGTKALKELAAFRALLTAKLVPAAEGRGFYTSGPVLSPGTWTVMVTGPGSSPVKATSVVSAKPAQSPPAASPLASRPAPTCDGHVLVTSPRQDCDDHHGPQSNHPC